MMVRSMVERRSFEAEGRMSGRVAWWAGAAATGFAAMVTLGFAVAHLKRAPGGSSRGTIILLAMLAVVATGTWALVRWQRLAGTGTAPVGPKQRANHRLLAWTGVLGGVIGLAMAVATDIATPRGEHPNLLFADLPPWFAVGIALGWGVVLPVITWRWHRVIDEHERDAYRDGATAGYYVMAIGAPVWWFLWRGGLAPAVNAFALFIAVMTVSGVVWMWRKYA